MGRRTPLRRDPGKLLRTLVRMSICMSMSMSISAPVFFFVLFFRQWITYTCICFLMAYNARPCVKELSAAADLKPAVPEYKGGRTGTWEMGAADFSFTVWVRISKVVSPPPPPARCI